jgi:hypothetical protein
MSTTAQDVSATLTQKTLTEDERANLSETDQIAELLVGEEDSETEDQTSDESQTEGSNQDDDEQSNENDSEDGDEETTLEAVADEDLTWGKVLGVDEDKLSFDDEGNLTGFTAKVNGEIINLTATELIEGFQVNKAVTTKAQALAEERKTFDTTREQVQQTYVSKLASVDALTTHFEKQLIAEYDNVDWTQLNAEDPARYAAMRLDFQTKAGELKNIQEAIQKDRQSEAEEFQKDNVGKQQVYLKQQFESMIEKNPDWADKKVRDTAQAGFRTFVNEQYGFSDQEFDSVFDARLIEMIKDAQRYHKAAEISGKKRLKKVPTFQKSVGGKKRTAPSKLEKLTAASKKATGQNKRDLQASAVAELLIG